MILKTEDIKILEAKSRHQCIDNIEKWGIQNQELLLLVILEELGELTRERLQNNYERNNLDLTNEYLELYDLMSVLYAYYINLEYERYGYRQYENIEDFYNQEVLDYDTNQ